MLFSSFYRRGSETWTPKSHATKSSLWIWPQSFWLKSWYIQAHSVSLQIKYLENECCMWLWNDFNDWSSSNVIFFKFQKWWKSYTILGYKKSQKHIPGFCVLKKHNKLFQKDSDFPKQTKKQLEAHMDIIWQKRGEPVTLLTKSHPHTSKGSCHLKKWTGGLWMTP